MHCMSESQCSWKSEYAVSMVSFLFIIILLMFILRGVAKNFYMGGPIQTMKVEINDDEYHRFMDSLYF